MEDGKHKKGMENLLYRVHICTRLFLLISLGTSMALFHLSLSTHTRAYVSAYKCMYVYISSWIFLTLMGLLGLSNHEKYMRDKEKYELEHGPGTFDEYIAAQKEVREVCMYICMQICMMFTFMLVYTCLSYLVYALPFVRLTHQFHDLNVLYM